MFHGPKGFIAQICEVHLQYGKSTTKWPFYTFSSKFHSNIYSILFGFSIISHESRDQAMISILFRSTDTFMLLLDIP